MLKKLACIGLSLMIVVSLSGCGKENKINEYDKEIEMVTNNNEKSFDEILITLYENKKEINDSNFFQTNSIHSETPGAWGDGIGELYYYSDDGYYLWNKSNYAYDKREVAKAGLWKIENGRLKLNELYTMYLDGGHFEEIIGNGGEVIKDLVGYEIVIKESDKILDMKIENKGLSDYAKDICGETKDDTYLLGDNKLWYSGTGAYIADMYWINHYYTNKVKVSDIKVEEHIIPEADETKKQGIKFIQFDTTFYPIEDLALEWRDSYKIKNYKDFEYDLDGDGEVDKITIRTKEGERWNGEAYIAQTYELNGKEFADVGNFGKIYIVDLNKNDNSIEVVTWDNGPSDDSVYNIYSKQGDKMECILNEWTENMYADQLGKILPSGLFNPSIYKKYYSFINDELKTIELGMDTISSIEFDAKGMYFSTDSGNFYDIAGKYHEYDTYEDGFERTLKACNVEEISGGTFKILEILGEEFFNVYVQLEDGRKGYIEEYIPLAG